jgi:hypothetical protein
MQMSPSTPGRHRRWSLAPTCALLLAAAGCHQAGRSIVRVHITAGTDMLRSSLTAATVTVNQGATVLRDAVSFDWDPSGITAGIYLSSDVRGMVQVSAKGLVVGTTVATSNQATIDDIVPGVASSALADLVLEPLRGDLPDGGGGTDGGAITDGGTGDGRGATGGDGRGATGGGGGSAVPDAGGAGGSGAGGSVVGVPDAGVDGGGSDAPIIVVARAWQPAVKAENNIDEADVRPQVVLDASGNALVVWEHGTAIWFNRYNAGTNTWGTEGPLTAVTGQSLQVAIDGNAVATAIWEAPSGTTPGIWTSTATGTSWSTPARLSSGNATDAHIAAGGNGAAIAAWTENNANNQFQLWVSQRPTAGGAWSAARVIKPATDTGDRVPTLAMDAAGNGFLIWEQAPAQPDPGNDHTTSVWVSRYSAGAFASPMALESYTAGDANSGHVALNASGAGMATWRQTFTDHDELWSRSYAGGVWAAPQMIVTASLIASYQVPHVAIDPAGNAVAVWTQPIASGAEQARISRHRVGQAAWDLPQPLETDNQTMGDASEDVSPEVGVDAVGNATVIWRKKSATGLINLWSRRLDATGALGTPVRIDSQNLHSVFGHQLAVASNGAAMGVWYYASEFDIWAAVWR